MDQTELGRMIEAAFAYGTNPDAMSPAALEAQIVRIRTLLALGYKFRQDLLYHRDGTKGATRIGLFDTTGPAPSLIEERCYTPEGERSDGLLHLLRDLNGTAPIGW